MADHAVAAVEQLQHLEGCARNLFAPVLHRQLDIAQVEATDVAGLGVTANPCYFCRVSSEFQNAVTRFEGAVELLRAIPSDRLRGARLLDVGCGQGNILLAAAQAGVTSATGIDIELNCFGYNWQREIAERYLIDTTVIGPPIEADFSDYQFDREFDVITCFDVLEHVARPAEFLRNLASVLVPGGFALIDVSPLYYSPVGHHLWDIFPRAEYPWVHLYHDFETLVRHANPDPWYMRHFCGLNRVTLLQTEELINGAGFTILSKRFNDTAGLEDFGRVEHRLAPSRLPPHRGDLFIEWMRFELTH